MKPYFTMGIVIILLITLLSFVATFLTDRVPERKDSFTLHEIAYCFRGIAHLEAEKHKSIQDLLHHLQASLSINQFLAERLVFDTNVGSHLLFSTNKPPTILDAWGSALNFATRTDIDSRMSRKLLETTNSLFIWSSGPNKSNEFGNGDDVILEWPEERWKYEGPTNKN